MSTYFWTSRRAESSHQDAKWQKDVLLIATSYCNYIDAVRKTKTKIHQNIIERKNCERIIRLSNIIKRVKGWRGKGESRLRVMQKVRHSPRREGVWAKRWLNMTSVTRGRGSTSQLLWDGLMCCHSLTSPWDWYQVGVPMLVSWHLFLTFVEIISNGLRLGAHWRTFLSMMGESGLPVCTHL